MNNDDDEGKRMQRAFDMTPEELGQCAVRAALRCEACEYEQHERTLAQTYHTCVAAPAAQDGQPNNGRVDATQGSVEPETRTLRSAHPIAAQDGRELDVFVKLALEQAGDQPRTYTQQLLHEAADAIAALRAERDEARASAESAEADHARESEALTQAIEQVAAERARAERAEEMEQFRNDQALRLTNRAERAEADAERYRWLRKFWIHARYDDPDGKIAVTATGDALDEIIDEAAAIDRARGGSK